MNSNQLRRPCVYGLKHGDQYFYVGKTNTNAKTRWWEHRGRARSGHTAPVYVYMREAGLENVTIEELDTDPTNEVIWITRLLAEGHPLQNQVSRDGVEGSMSAESRQKIGDGNAGGTSWIAGKTGEEAGWTAERKEVQSARIAYINENRRNDMTITTQNRAGGWVPAIPLPLFLSRGRVQCDCGEKFKDHKKYREHYALSHVLDLD